MDEKRKTSESVLKAVKKYRERCVRKEVIFYPSEIELLDKAEDKASEQKKTFAKYVKDLILEDIEKQARLF